MLSCWVVSGRVQRPRIIHGVGVRRHVALDLLGESDLTAVDSRLAGLSGPVALSHRDLVRAWMLQATADPASPRHTVSVSA